MNICICCECDLDIFDTGLITACMFLGTAAGRLGKKAKPFLDFFAVSTEVVLQVLRWFLW